MGVQVVNVKRYDGYSMTLKTILLALLILANMNEKIGIGVIGVGLWGEMHVMHYSNIPSAKLIAVSDRTEDRAEYIARKYKVGAYYSDYKKLLDNPEIEAVSVVYPDFLHRDVVIDAAKAGKHVYVEKPMATTVEDAEAMLAAARKSGIKLMVGFCNRWNPPYVRAKEAIIKGELGQLLYAYSRINFSIDLFTDIYSWSAKTTIAWYLMSHTVDLVRWLFNSEAKKVYAVSCSKVLAKQGIKTSDYFAAIIHFENGAIGNFESACILPKTRPSSIDFKSELIGGDGCMYIETKGDGYGVPGTEKYTKSEASYPNVIPFFEKEALKHFIESIIEDKTPEPSGEDGLANTKILCAIHKSAKTGKIITLK